MSKKIDFDKLYEYIRSDIFEYDKETPLPRWFVMRLKGLHEGKFYANKKSKSNGEYSYKAIYATFKLNSKYIKRLIKTNKFNNEKHKINYIMVIIEGKINDVVLAIKRKEGSEKIAKKQIDKEINQTKQSAEYKKDKKGKLSKKQKEIW